MYIFILFMFCVIFSIIFGGLFDLDGLFVFGLYGLLLLWIFVCFVKLFC